MEQSIHSIVAGEGHRNIVDNYINLLNLDVTLTNVQLYWAACVGNNGYLCKPIELGCDMNKTK